MQLSRQTKVKMEAKRKERTVYKSLVTYKLLSFVRY